MTFIFGPATCSIPFIRLIMIEPTAIIPVINQWNHIPTPSSGSSITQQCNTVIFKTRVQKSPHHPVASSILHSNQFHADERADRLPIRFSFLVIWFQIKASLFWHVFSLMFEPLPKTAIPVSPFYISMCSVIRGAPSPRTQLLRVLVIWSSCQLHRDVLIT